QAPGQAQQLAHRRGAPETRRRSSTGFFLRGVHSSHQIKSLSRIGATPVLMDRRAPGNDDPGAERLRLERELFERYLAEGDIEARQRLIERFLPLARKLVR